MTKREATGAVLRMLLPDGEITPGYIDKLLEELEERHDNHARRQAEVAREDRVIEGLDSPFGVACNRQGALVGMLRHRSKEAEAVLAAQSDEDTRAALLWLMGAELGLWAADPELIAATREECGLDAPREASHPKTEKKPMATPSPDTDRACVGIISPSRELEIAGQLIGRIIADPDVNSAARFAAIRHWHDHALGKRLWRPPASARGRSNRHFGLAGDP